MPILLNLPIALLPDGAGSSVPENPRLCDHVTSLHPDRLAGKPVAEHVDHPQCKWMIAQLPPHRSLPLVR